MGFVTGLRRCFCSRATTVGLVTFLVLWIGYGTRRTWMRLRNPDSTIAVEVVLLHAPGEYVAARGTGLFHSLASERMLGLLQGPCELEVRRDEKRPCFVLLDFAVEDLPPGVDLSVRPAGGEPVELGPPCGRHTWVALPVRGRKATWRLDPGGPNVRYRFFDPWFSARILYADDQPFEPRLHTEMGPPIPVSGGTLRPGSGPGWREDLPDDPIRIDGHAWLELQPDRPGRCTLRVPLQCPSGAPAPELWLDGRRLAFTLEENELVAAVRLQNPGLLVIRGAPCWVRLRDLRFEDP